MTRRQDARPAAALELKSTRLTGIQINLMTVERAALAQHVDAMFSATPDFFGGEAAVFDCTRLPADSAAPDWVWLADAFRSRGLYPYAVRNAGESVANAARAAGLAVLDASAVTRPVAALQPLSDPSDAPADAPREPELDPAPAAAAVPASAPLPDTDPAVVATRVVDKPLRSGQRVYAQGGDLVVLAVVNPGAEVIADGSIHVYAPLKGRALAGATGDTGARIFTTRFEAELVSIAGVYRTFDAAPDLRVHQKPAQIRLLDASQLDIAPL